MVLIIVLGELSVKLKAFVVS